ncbi:DUF421 domain-containing protein [Bacillus sp. V3B]|nr:DUF421 domain-containing protein [Bacillus sp. V3B]MCQ6274883.1 DUF421 domain-containing protein [Bacillus sp. V3B]
MALFIVVKLLGKNQLSQITPFDFISALVMGELVGSAIFDQKAGILQILFAIAVWGSLIFFTELLTQKFRSMRYLFEGRPVMIINQGKLDWKAMKKNQIDVDQLQELLRFKDVFSLQDVEYAILENNGGVSVLRKSEVDQPTCRDLKIKGEKRTVPLTIISDGEVLANNLKKAGVNEDWLYKQLKIKGVDRPKEISYAEYEPGKDLFIQKY